LDSLTGWALGTAITGSSSFGKEFSWLLRLSEDDIEKPLIAKATGLLNCDEQVAHEAAHIILDALGTAEGGALKEFHPLPESEFERKFRLEREKDPCRSLFAWSDDDCLRCMERNDVYVVRAVQRVGRRILDPNYPVPSSLLQRALALVDALPVSIRSGMSQTTQDHEFEQISPLLAAREPHGLADFIRSVVRTMPERNIEAQRSLCFWLPEIGPLFQAPEVKALARSLEDLYAEPRHWTPTSPGNVTAGQWVETFSLMGLLPHLTDAELLEWTLKRPDNAFDEARHDHLVRPLTADLGQRLLALIHEELSPSKLGRILRLIQRTEVGLSSVDRERLAQLAASDDSYVRASCLRFACEVGDHDLGMRILTQGRYFGNACWIEENWGSRLVLRFSSDLAFDEIASRVHLAVLAHSVALRGNRPEEVRALSELLEVIFQEVLGASDPEGITVPRVVLLPEDRPLGIELPDFGEPEDTALRADGRSPDALSFSPDSTSS
jgi:hypothetical protein